VPGVWPAGSGWLKGVTSFAAVMNHDSNINKRIRAKLGPSGDSELMRLMYVIPSRDEVGLQRFA
jgi:hypothetical protein